MLRLSDRPAGKWYCHRRFPDEEGTEIFKSNFISFFHKNCHRRFPDEEGTEIASGNLGHPVVGSKQNHEFEFRHGSAKLQPSGGHAR